MLMQEALRIANERRAEKGMPAIPCVPSNKKCPEYAEIFRITNEGLASRIRSAIANDRYAEQRKTLVARR